MLGHREPGGHREKKTVNADMLMDRCCLFPFSLPCESPTYSGVAHIPELLRQGRIAASYIQDPSSTRHLEVLHSRQRAPVYSAPALKQGKCCTHHYGSNNGLDRVEINYLQGLYDWILLPVEGWKPIKRVLQVWGAILVCAVPPVSNFTDRCLIAMQYVPLSLLHHF